MMKANISKFFWPAILILYLVTRLVNLKIIPIFTDEAIYSYWAQVALNDAAHRFISLEDGKQPLFIWLAAIYQNFVADPLLASRLVSVTAGLGSLIGIYLLSKELFNKKIAQLSAFLYIVLPFTLLYDRMALFDSLLTMFGIWAVLFSVKMAKDPKLDIALLNGFAIGLAMITKSSGVIFLYLLPISLILTNFNNKNIKNFLFKWGGLTLISALIAQVIYNSLRVSPLFYIISQKNLAFIRSTREVIEDPFLFLQANFSSMLGWIISYLGIILFAIFVVGVVSAVTKRNLKVIYLSILIFAPFLAESLFNKVLYPRFMLFYYPFVVLIVAYSAIELIKIFKKYSHIVITLFIVALLVPTINSFKLLTDPPNAKIAQSDSEQYINAWPAGYGVSEVVKILEDESKRGDVFIGTEGTFGLFPFSLNIYLSQNKNVHILPFWPVNENNLPPDIVEAAQNNKTYFVFNEKQKEITNANLKLVGKYQKGNGNSFMRLYEVMPQ